MSLKQEFELLRRVPFFAEIEPSKLKLLAFMSERVGFDPGKNLMRQGDQADAAYLIIDGRAEVILETPSDLNRVNSFLNLRVADIWACYKEWGDKGAFFLTEPLANPDGWEWRCYMRDPDGYLIEVGQYTQMALDHFKNDAR